MDTIKNAGNYVSDKLQGISPQIERDWLFDDPIRMLTGFTQAPPTALPRKPTRRSPRTTTLASALGMQTYPASFHLGGNATQRCISAG